MFCIKHQSYSSTQIVHVIDNVQQYDIKQITLHKVLESTLDTDVLFSQTVKFIEELNLSYLFF
jgi:hypothetical protein